MKAQDIMSGPAITVKAESTVEEAATKMKEANVGALPVHGAGSPCGIVTDRDIAIKAVAAGKGAATQVGEICTLSAITVDPEAGIDEVAHLMKKHQVRRLPVVKGDVIQGMLSLGDVVLAQQQLGGEALASISKPSVSLGAGSQPSSHA